MITTVLFVLAAALAIPTFGISLIAFFCAKLWWDRLSGQTIAKYVYLSQKHDGKPYDLHKINGAAIRYFFSKFGDDIASYNFDTTSGAYTGRVNIKGVGDLSVSVIQRKNRITIRAVKSPTKTVDGVNDVPYLDELIAADATFSEAGRKALEAAERALANSRTRARSTESRVDDDVPF